MAKSIEATEQFLASAGQVLSVFSDVSSWQVQDQPRVISAKENKVTLAFEDLSRAVIIMEPTESGSVAKILHELLRDDSQIRARETYWHEVLLEMHRRLDQK